MYDEMEIEGAKKLAQYKDAFAKIDVWCRQNIRHTVRVSFGNDTHHGYACEASPNGVMALEGHHTWGNDVYTNGFTVDKDWNVCSGNKYMEAHIVNWARARCIEKLVRYWHDEVKEKLLRADAKESTFDNFEA